MAYVDIESLKRNIKVNIMPNVDIDGKVVVEDAEKYFLNIIDKTSTLDIIKCKECQYWIGDDYDGCCTQSRLATKYAHDFCNYGKRKGDA